jgi:DNA-binding transcriptional LysR family regulator
MDTEKSRALLKIIETGSFSQAAEELGYTPSGINRMVKTMEEETGFPLFTRSTAGVQLTTEGRQLLPAFHELVHWQEQLDQLCADIRGLSTGHLTIGTYYSIAASWLPQIIQHFQANWPGIQIDLCEAGNNDLRQRLADHTIDCCFSANIRDSATGFPCNATSSSSGCLKNTPWPMLPASPWNH